MAMIRPHASLGEAKRVCDGMHLSLVDTSALRGGPAPVRLSRFELSEGGESPLDTHEEREIWMIAAGSGHLRYAGGDALAVRQGDVLEFESHASHTLRNTGVGPLLVFSIWWGSESGV